MPAELKLVVGPDERDLYKRLVELTTQKLPCGDCTACCDAIGVEELGKPYSCECEHQSKSGCAIYGKHPASCKGFNCFWTTGVFSDLAELRPDQCGYILCLSACEGGAALDVYATRKDGLDRRVLEKLVAVILAEMGGLILYVREYPHGAKVGVEYPIDPKYPETGHTGNCFIKSGRRLLWLHANPR